MQRIRLLLLLHTLSPSGAPKVILDAIEELQNDLDIFCVALGGGAYSERCRRFGKLSIVAKSSKGASFVRLSKSKIYNAALGHSIRKWKPDIIYINSVAALPIAKYVRFPIAPILLHVHELDSYLSAQMRSNPDLLCHWPDRYIVVSEAAREALARICEITGDRVVVIHSFVKEQEFINCPCPVNANEEGTIVVGGAGAVCWHKGTTLWLQMAAELHRIMGDHPIRFVWVGITDCEAGLQFRAEARKLGIDSIIEFVPLTEEPLKEFARFDIFATTSWEESFSLVVLENMMLRKPVVCFAGSGGPREVVGDAGIVIDSFSPLAMAEAIEQLARSPELRKALGTAARERALKHFTASVQAPKILCEIKKLVQIPKNGDRRK